jgi:hypothetical protein
MNVCYLDPQSVIVYDCQYDYLAERISPAFPNRCMRASRTRLCTILINFIYVQSDPTEGELARQAAEEAVRSGRLVIPNPGGDLAKADSTAGLFMETILTSVALERAALALAVRIWLQLWLLFPNEPRAMSLSPFMVTLLHWKNNKVSQATNELCNITTLCGLAETATIASSWNLVDKLSKMPWKEKAEFLGSTPTPTCMCKILLLSDAI